MKGATTRVMMTADAVGGVFTYVASLASELSERGVRVLVVCMGPAPSDEQRAQLRALPDVSLVETPHRLEWMNEPWEDVDRAGRTLLALERSFRPDVVHLNGYAHGELPFRAPKLVVAHSCVLSWWKAVHGEAAPSSYDVYRARVSRGLRAADAVVAPTCAMRSLLQEHYGPVPTARVLFNGYDPARFTPKAKQAFILAAGRVWDRAKNLHALAELSPELAWPVVIVGETSEPHRAADVRSPRFLGKLSQPELAERLAEAAIFAAPARYEPFGLSILEAAASGCALVLGDIQSLRELWHDAALFVPPDDHAALRTALATLIEDVSLRQRLAANAQQRARRYPQAASAQRYLALYDALQQRRAVPTSLFTSSP